MEELRGLGGITAVKGAHEGAGDVFRRFGASAAREGERGGAGDEQGGRLDEAAAVDHDGFLLYLSFWPGTSIDKPEDVRAFFRSLPKKQREMRDGVISEPYSNARGTVTRR